jgi:hypothetical protein
MTKSICTVVSFGGSSNVGYKIAMQHTDGSMVTLTELAAITKAGMNYIPSQLLVVIQFNSISFNKEHKNYVYNCKNYYNYN